MAKQAALSSATQNTTPSHDEIAAQAYQIYLREGCTQGRDLDHWLRAEAELRERVTKEKIDANGNGHANGGTDRSQATAPLARNHQEQSSILPNNVAPPPTLPITGAVRNAAPRRNSGKREAAAVK